MFKRELFKIRDEPSKCLRHFSSHRDRTIPVTIKNIFSEENKHRVQNNLHSVKPVKKSATFRKEIPRAAVLIPLCTIHGEPSIMLTLRSSQLNSHRGHVSFPGGKMDKTDRDLIHTALRETEEEVGLPMNHVEVWGHLTPTPSRNRLLVTPVIGFCGELDVTSLTPNHQEVDEIFTRTISSLCDPKGLRTTRFQTGQGYTLPVFLGEQKIWGLTAVFLHQALSILAPGLYDLTLPLAR